jgi:hypothetical protein
MDQWGRYKIPDPLTGKERSWTRATTWAKTLAEMHGIMKWELRMSALGLARRPDLLASVAAVLDPESTKGKKKLNELCDAAKEYGGASTRANLGSALHEFAEAVDSDRKVAEIPPPFDVDIEAYRKAMQAVRVSRNYIEKIGLVVELGVAGTMDRVVQLTHSPLPMIGDLKTGKDLSYSWAEIAIQLALYAHADTVFDPVEQVHRPMLPVDQEKALVIHLPAGEGRCSLYVVDIRTGWEMAAICGQVRAYRDRKDLAQLIVEKSA